MKRLRRKFSVSERRACRGVGLSRTSIRYRRREKSDESAIRKRLHVLARQRPRFGYRQMTRLLRLEGFRVSFKRVHRIWKAEGLKVRQKQKKKRGKGKSKHACHRLRAERMNHVWCWDFIFDRTTTGHSLKWLSIVDEYSRRCITLDVGRRMTSEDVINRLAELFVMYGVPECVRGGVNGMRYNKCLFSSCFPLCFPRSPSLLVGTKIRYLMSWLFLMRCSTYARVFVGH